MIQVHGKATDEELDGKNCVGWNAPVKVNIRYKEHTTNGEGIWARACTEEDAKTYGSSKAGLEFFVFLLNNPICPDVKYGDKIKCRTTGKDTRPISAEVSSSEEEYNSVKKALGA
jgi:hypothetical protein